MCCMCQRLIHLFFCVCACVFVAPGGGQTANEQLKMKTLKALEGLKQRLETNQKMLDSSESTLKAEQARPTQEGHRGRGKAWPAPQSGAGSERMRGLGAGEQSDA